MRRHFTVLSLLVSLGAMLIFAGLNMVVPAGLAGLVFILIILWNMF